MVTAKTQKNPKEEFYRSQPFAQITPELEDLRASHEGELISSNGIVWKMAIRFNPVQMKNLVNANLEIDLFENSHLVPTLKYNSGLRKIPDQANEPDAIHLEIIRNNYLQLFYLEKLNIWAGNYYLADSSGKFCTLGTVSLTRTGR